MTDKYLSLSDGIASGNETFTKCWRGKYESFVLLKKQHKPFYFEKKKWLVLSQLGNLYFFNYPDSSYHNSVYNIYKLNVKFDKDTVLFFNNEKKIRIKLDDVSSFKDIYYQVLNTKKRKLID